MPSDTPQGDFTSVFSSLAGLIACPACAAGLKLAGEQLVCTGCGRSYPIVDGIPVLIANQVD